jgi:hypothetical protein
MICIASYLHEDGALICKCDRFIYNFLLALFNLSAVRFGVHSSSIVLCNFLKLKSDISKRIFPTIQKPYLCVYCNSAMAGASDAMKPERFAGGNFRR